MKRIIIYINIFLALTILSSCVKDYLNRAPEIALTDEAVFADPALASQFADNAYNFLINDYARLNGHRGITGQFSDEAVSANNDVSIRTINSGNYHDHYERGGESINDIKDVYWRCYQGIRITNVVLSKLNTIPWAADGVLKNRVEGEMHFLRAFFYFELTKRFGDVVIMKDVFDQFDDIDFPRNSYDECVNFMLEDLQVAEDRLDFDYAAGDYGRATKGAAMALRARILLYAASPLHNPGNDLSKWTAAAEASKKIIDLGKYTLAGTSYDQILNMAQSDEYIMIKPRGPRANSDGIIVDFAQSPGSGGSQGTLNPTQNHVDLYEVVQRAVPSNPNSPIVSSSPLVNGTAPGYNDQKPYENRDPRFYANIIYNDMPWQGRRIDMYSQKSGLGYDFIDGNTNYTVTCYYSKKMWPEVYRRNVAGTTLINFIFFRYGEVLLNYAEAMNEAYGPDDVPAGYTMSSRQAIQTVRDRVGMPALPAGLNKDEMRGRIRNERAVELAFEDFRWYDILRWRAKELVTQPMYGIRVVKNANGSFTYTRTKLTSSYQKVHEPYMDLYPIPRSEIYKSRNLTQNPGW
ncbi:RagB/SusD family nutrient uptake outer membrane protein [Pararcticibacter amylolyticus]|uniref:RagB/SusD family nutrient uptake outer membrane protein n=1 Tax=Pararcticibacter amylolyticus TaxID=2173175 RepID=A0A2U2PLC4_9SPHI|nr:RagB/SusD family nutrient uptake outer membrane protein [Pararcticibacter amylolyticus]PWG82213.1 RagB/SusD family nutrient uptake outer membrane protein [Pararcticibacter amylolyticus]